MTRQRTFTLLSAAVLVLAAGGAALAARAGDDRSAAAPRPAASSAPPQRVVLPGKPGESAQVTDSDQVRAPDGSTYNAVDVTFVQMMIVHHAQALEMTKLAPQRAGNAGLRALADRMGATQGPEMERLKQWLQSRKLPPSDPRHDHSTMPGMQTPADLAALAAAKGPAFDRKFITMMSAHHQGAIRMAGDVLRGGSDQVLHDMATDIAVEQGSEIRRMQQL